jgi:16S rRNA processing protein RimM
MSEQVYLVKDLVGCRVVTVQGDELGLLRDVLPTGGNDVYVVNEGAAEVLVPALKSVVKNVDIAGKVIQVDLPEGLRPIDGDAEKDAI